MEIKKPLISYYKQNEKLKSDILIENLLKGKNIAIVSDAGTPIISDPGEEVVKQAIEKEIEIIPIPGACALINGLIVSGIPSKEFTFLGFLSTNKKEKREKLEEYKNYIHTLIFYEAPHKLIATLEMIKEVLGDRSITLARELTKIHEEFIRGKVSEIMGKYDSPKGEFVIIVEGAKKSENDSIKELVNILSLEEHFEYYKKRGYEKKEIIKKIAKDRNVGKNEIYQYFINN